MIEWMQRHKKWLIVTIWISTIAFVGAGFVGWGSYDYGKSNDTVAIVGNKEVPFKDLQNEYSNLYSQYQQMLGGQFNQELAKQFRLEDIALQRVTQKYLILNYADELGLISTDEEVASELVKINSFFKEGKFDKQTYINVLKQNRRTATEFEEQLKQDILVNKVNNLFSTSLQDNELKNMSSLIFSQDEVSIKIIDDKNIKINYTNEDLQKYWSANKENYKSEGGFSIGYSKIANIDGKSKKEMKKIALKEYLSLKKGKSKFQENKILLESSTFLNADDLKKIIQSKEGSILKPIYKDDHYYVIKANKKILPQVLDYKIVEQKVLNDYIVSKKSALLEENANKLMNNFKGKSIGYISRTNIPKISGLTKIEKDQFIKHLFGSSKAINKVNLGSKILVYKITNSKLASFNNLNEQTVFKTIDNLKTSSLSSSLLAKLATRYEIKTFTGKN